MLNIYQTIIILFIIVGIEYFLDKKLQKEKYNTRSTLHNLLAGIILLTFSSLVVSQMIHLSYYIPKIFYFNFDLTNFVLCLLLLDLGYYSVHRINHSNKILRRLHSIHHSDKYVNLSTAFRISWLEQIYIFPFISIIPIIFGFDIYMIVLSSYIFMLYQFFCHSAYIKFPTWINWILVTPQSHLIHHDNKSENANSNYGGVFSFWDQIFDTENRAKVEKVNPGLNSNKQIDPLSIYNQLGL